MPVNLHYFSITRGLVGGAIMVGVAACVVDCGTSPTPSSTQHLKQAKPKSTAAVQDIQGHTFEQKGEFTVTMQAQLDDLKRDLDRLATTISASSDAVQSEACPKLAALRAELTKMSQHLDQVSNAEASTWSEVKSSITTGYTTTRDGIRSARKWTSELTTH